MFLAAIAHHYTFTYKPYVQVNFCRSVFLSSLSSGSPFKLM